MYFSRNTIFGLTTFTLLAGASFYFVLVVQLSRTARNVPSLDSNKRWLEKRINLQNKHNISEMFQNASFVGKERTGFGNQKIDSNIPGSTRTQMNENRTTSLDQRENNLMTIDQKATATHTQNATHSQRTIIPPIQNLRIRRHELPETLKDLTIMYYMVPKCGSRTFLYLMEKLKGLNPNLRDVLAFTSAEEETREARTKRVPKFVAGAKKPAFLYVDTHFVPVKYPKNVMYISLVRDPMTRFLSQFNFHNFGDNFTTPKDEPNWMKLKRATLDDCVRNEQQICSGRWLGRAIHSRFCGTGVICYQTCPKNFKQSKRNLLQKYHVVGMLEEFEDFLRVLERLIPSIFDGILDLYRHPSTKEFMSRVKTAKKDKPSEETLAKLRGYLQRDYEFYDTVKHKFYQLKEKLGVKTANESEVMK